MHQPLSSGAQGNANSELLLLNSVLVSYNTTGSRQEFLATPVFLKDFFQKRYTWSLRCQKQVHFKTKYKSHARSPAIGQRHVVPVFGLTRPGTPGFVYFV